MGNIVYGDTYYYDFTFTALPCAYIIGRKNFVPTHILFSPGVFWNGTSSFNPIMGYRIYSLDRNSEDKFMDGTVNKYAGLITRTNLKWVSQLSNPSLYIPWDRPLSMIVEFYGAGLGAISGSVNADFCIRSIKQSD